MSRLLAICTVGVLALTHVANAQWLYWVEETRTDPPKLALYRKPLDGGLRETVLAPTEERYYQMQDRKVNDGFYSFDPAGGKLYWLERDAPQSGNSSIWRADLDGSNPELFTQSAGGADMPFIISSLKVIRPPGGTVPAVSTWGLGMMLLVSVALGTLIMKRAGQHG